MGVSTDAILVYGYDLGAEDELDCEAVSWLGEDTESLSEAIDDRLLTVIGFTEQWSGTDGYFERKRAARAKLGVELVYHCSDDDPMLILAAIGTEVRANRGYPKTVASLTVPEGADDRLAWAMRVLELKPEGSPSWLLASNWG